MRHGYSDEGGSGPSESTLAEYARFGALSEEEQECELATAHINQLAHSVECGSAIEYSESVRDSLDGDFTEVQVVVVTRPSAFGRGGREVRHFQSYGVGVKVLEGLRERGIVV